MTLGNVRHLAVGGLVLCMLGGMLPLCAQGPAIEARVTAVQGAAALIPVDGSGARNLVRGDLLQVRDRVDTTAGGTAVISMSDGSIVSIQSGSVIVMQDYRDASSLRELFTILLGRVRVKINHFEGKPNPYKMNTPTASIAVRGTEFLIAVRHRGDTEVIVYEGLVEVSFLDNPAKRTLLPGGAGLWLIPGFDFQFFTPTGKDMDERGPAQAQNNQQQNKSAPPQVAKQDGGGKPSGGQSTVPLTGPNQSGGGSAPQIQPMRQGAFADHDEASPRASGGTYNRYLSSLASLGQVPLLLRFNAFPEAYLDSLQNPAYATNFHSAEGRAYVLPSLSGVPESSETSSNFGGSGGSPADFAIAGQLAYFHPYKGWTFGGSGSITYVDNATGRDTDGAIPVNSSSSTTRYFTGNILAARRFGKISIGLEAEELRGSSDLFSSLQVRGEEGKTSQISTRYNSSIQQSRFTAGVKHLAGRSEEGAFVRYAFIDVGNISQAPSYGGGGAALNTTNTSGHSLEAGVRWRAYLTPKLYFGLEGSWIGFSLRDTAAQRSSYMNQTDRAARESLGVGFGYILKRKTSLTADFATGHTSISAMSLMPSRERTDSAQGVASGNFQSLHFAVQTEFTRRIFGVASYVNVWQSQGLTYQWTGNEKFTPSSDGFFSNTLSSYLTAGHYSDFGLGYRFTPRTFVQYVFSTDYGFSAHSHTLMLRYTFGGRSD